MNREIFRQNILELIRRTSAFLPPDVESVINLQRKLETAGSKADFALELVAQNIGLAKARSLPICQDTGTINFFFETPRGEKEIDRAGILTDRQRPGLCQSDILSDQFQCKVRLRACSFQFALQ